MLKIDGSTEVYGIIGNPVRHSRSPAMHNAAFAACGLNKVYVPLPALDGAAAVAAIRTLGIAGASVTIPHKETVIEQLDKVDPVAARIGAVNTIVRRGDELHGANTDWLGANQALGEALELAGAKVLLLGAGGSARAIGFGLREAGAKVILASRTPERGQELAQQLDCPWVPLEQAAEQAANALVNATSVGMAPLAEQSPLPAAALAAFPVVMDIVYSPLQTRLLREAEAAGCHCIDGLAMLLYQGAAQFTMWTNQEAPLAIMRQTLLENL
ncbi:shikimate 5-dehydrogenase [Desulfurivibrio alkaliphilus AHT 2]|uniref:Shikimate dehydrogenase (NADP(+)) n=1 Tax=Desulfurivibrio alkaliphilus (strain DSM 19089 / UNIQEM U267 / AHT2) TaxID=589865 RepID=D6Z569_DESAT|nr:shikimate 5-dehydrogenase [Desulfurivibrio alkaliphilus AHT 2]